MQNSHFSAQFQLFLNNFTSSTRRFCFSFGLHSRSIWPQVSHFRVATSASCLCFWLLGVFPPAPLAYLARPGPLFSSWPSKHSHAAHHKHQQRLGRGGQPPTESYTHNSVRRQCSVLLTDRCHAPVAPGRWATNSLRDQRQLQAEFFSVRTHSA